MVSGPVNDAGCLDPWTPRRKGGADRPGRRACNRAGARYTEAARRNAGRGNRERTLDPQGTVFWILAVLAAALVGLSKGGLPVVGMLGVPVMALQVSPILAAGLLLPVYVVSDIFGVWAYRHAFNRRVLAIMLPAAVVGIAIGWATASLVPERLITGIIGLIGASFAARLLLQRGPEGPGRPAEVAPGLFWGRSRGSPASSAMPARRPTRSMSCR